MTKKENQPRDLSKVKKEETLIFFGHIKPCVPVLSPVFPCLLSYSLSASTLVYSVQWLTQEGARTANPEAAV